MKLSQREMTILDFLLVQNHYVNYQEIAIAFSLTERMVRYDIEKIDYFLLQNQLEPLNRNPKKGVMIGKRDELRQVVASFKQRATPKAYKYSKMEVESFILLTLLLAKEAVPVAYFEDILFISRTSVLNSLKQLAKKKQSLNIKHIKRKGYQIEGELMERYLAFANLLLESLNLRELYLFIETEDIIFSKEAELIIFNVFDLEKLSRSYKLVKKIEQYTGREFDDGFSTLLLTLIYSILEENAEWQLGTFMIKNNNELSETERLLRLLVNDAPTVMRADKQLDVKQSALELMESVASYFEQEPSTFSDGFLAQLTAHLSNMIERNRKGIQTVNPIYNEIVSDYTDLFNLIKTNIGRIEQVYRMTISDHEVSFLVIYFASERENRVISQKKKPTVLVVCVEGMAVSQMIQSQLKKVFDFNKIESSSLKNFSVTDLKTYDFIISTVELPDIDSPKVIKINNYLTESDIKRLHRHFNRKLLNSRENSLSHFNPIMETIRENTTEITNLSKLELDLIQILTKNERFSQHELMPEIHFSAKNISIISTRLRWEEAIEIGTNGLEGINATQPAYKKRIMHNIRQHGPYMVIAPKVMIAHAGMEDGVNQAGLWVTVLKKGINMTGKFSEDVQLIMTIALKDQTTHRVMENIAKLAFNEPIIQTVLASTNSAEIYSIVTANLYK